MIPPNRNSEWRSLPCRGFRAQPPGVKVFLIFFLAFPNDIFCSVNYGLLVYSGPTIGSLRPMWKENAQSAQLANRLHYNLLFPSAMCFIGSGLSGLSLRRFGSTTLRYLGSGE